MDTNKESSIHLIDVALVLVFSAAFFGFGLGHHVPLSDHEGLVAVTAQEACQNGHWIVPHYNGQLRLQKTPLMYWTVAASAHLLGRLDEFVVRLPSAISATAVALMMSILAAIMFDRITGIITGLATAGSSGMLWQSHRGTADMLLTACIVGTMICIYLGIEAGRQNRPSRRWFILGYLAFAFGMLAKGPVPAPAVILPVLVYLFWLIGRDHPISRPLPKHIPAALKTIICWIGKLITLVWKQLLKFRLLWGLIILLLIVGTWALAILLTVPNATDRWFEEYVARALGQFGTKRAWHYYLPQIFLLTLPWSIFLPAGLITVFHHTTATRRRELVFLFAWLVVDLVFFSAAEGKRAHYILPIVPPAILLSIAGMTFVLRRWASPRAVLWTLALTVSITVIAAASVGILWLNDTYPQLMKTYCVLVSILLAMEVLGALAYMQWGGLPMATVIVLGSGLCFAIVWPTVPLVTDPARDPIHAAELLEQRVGKNAEIHFIGRANAPLVYYYGSNMPQIPTDQDITKIYLKAKEGDRDDAVIQLMEQTTEGVFDLISQPGQRYFIISDERFAIAKGEAIKRKTEIYEVLRLPRYFSTTKGAVVFGNRPPEKTPTSAP